MCELSLRQGSTSSVEAVEMAGRFRRFSGSVGRNLLRYLSSCARAPRWLNAAAISAGAPQWPEESSRDEATEVLRSAQEHPEVACYSAPTSAALPG